MPLIIDASPDYATLRHCYDTLPCQYFAEYDSYAHFHVDYLRCYDIYLLLPLRFRDYAVDGDISMLIFRIFIFITDAPPLRQLPASHFRHCH